MKQVASGSKNKSDALIKMERIKGRSKIEYSSTVSVFYSEHHMNLILSVLGDLNQDNLLVSVEDNQALDFVLKARLKAAVSSLQRMEDQL